MRPSLAPSSQPRSFLAFDFGSRRIGVATGNTLTGTATPRDHAGAAPGGPARRHRRADRRMATRCAGRRRALPSGRRCPRQHGCGTPLRSATAGSLRPAGARGRRALHDDRGARPRRRRPRRGRGRADPRAAPGGQRNDRPRCRSALRAATLRRDPARATRRGAGRHLVGAVPGSPSVCTATWRSPASRGVISSALHRDDFSQRGLSAGATTRDCPSRSRAATSSSSTTCSTPAAPSAPPSTSCTTSAAPASVVLAVLVDRGAASCRSPPGWRWRRSISRRTNGCHWPATTAAASVSRSEASLPCSSAAIRSSTATTSSSICCRSKACRRPSSTTSSTRPARSSASTTAT